MVQLCKEKLAGGKHLAWRGSFELFDESVEQIRNECSFHDIPITLHDAKHRSSAALSDGGYQGEKLAASIKGAKVCIAAVTASKNSHGC